MDSGWENWEIEWKSSPLMSVAWNGVVCELLISPFQWTRALNHIANEQNPLMKSVMDFWEESKKYISERNLGWIIKRNMTRIAERNLGWVVKIRSRSKPCSSVSFPFCQAQSFQEQIASNKKESGLCRSLIKKKHNSTIFASLF